MFPSEETVGLKLTILGAAAAWSELPARPSSCYLVEERQPRHRPRPRARLPQFRFDIATHPAFKPSWSATCTATITSTSSRCQSAPLRLRPAATVGLHDPRTLRRPYDVFTGKAASSTSWAVRTGQGTRQIGPFVLQVQPVTHSEQSHAFRVTSLQPRCSWSRLQWRLRPGRRSAAAHPRRRHAALRSLLVHPRARTRSQASDRPRSG